MQTLDQTFGRDTVNDQSNPGLIRELPGAESRLPGQQLRWRAALGFSAVHVARIACQRRSTSFTASRRPQSYLLGFFNADDKSQVSPNSKFRILNANTLSISQKGERKQAQLFNNRNLEKLFTKFDSVKFFLTREHLREVIVRR